MLFTFATIALAQASLSPLQPVEPWTLSSRDDGCTTGRVYGDDHAIEIGIQDAMHLRPTFLLVRGPSKLLPGGDGSISLTVDGSTTVIVRYVSFETSESEVRTIRLSLDYATMTQLAKATTITVGNKMPTLDVNGIKAAIDATDRCTSDKLISYGVDPKLYFESKTTVIGLEFARMFDAQSYPKEARPKKAYGRMVLLLNTGTDGSVTNCKVLASPDESLNTGTCEIAKRGRLQPPIGSDGQPIASYAILPVRWVRPN